MYYNSFLILLSQLAFREEGKILLYGYEIKVKNFPSFSRWELSAAIAATHFPSFVQEGLRSGRKIALESSNSYLQKNQDIITFVQIVPSPRQYLQYKQCIENFLEGLSLWVELQRPLLKSSH